MTTEGTLEAFELTGPGVPATIAAALHWSHALTDWFGQNLPNQAATPEVRVQDMAALAFFSMALNHRDSVVALASLDQRSSTLALARSMLEAYVRGVWFHMCATPDQVRGLVNENRDPAGFDSMSTRLVKLGFPHIDSIKRHYKVLCDYSHGGGRQASRWMATSEISPRHRDGEVIEVLQLVNFVACLAARDLAFVAGYASERYQEKAFAVSAEIQSQRDTSADSTK